MADHDRVDLAAKVASNFPRITYLTKLSPSDWEARYPTLPTYFLHGQETDAISILTNSTKSNKISNPDLQ